MTAQAFDLEFSTIRLLLLTLQHGSLSVAAVALSISKGAASKRLSAAREYFGDRLFVRTANRMIPTERMIELGPRLQSLVDAAEALKTPTPVFSPETAQGVIRIAAVDNAALVCFRTAFQRMIRLAPYLSFEFEELQNNTLDRLRSGVIDFGIFCHRGQKLPPSFCEVLLYRTKHVLVADAEHPLVRLSKIRPLVPADLQPYRRIGITINRPTGGHLHGIIDRLGTQADYALHIPHFLAGILFAEGTDLIVNAPEPLARIAVRFGNLAILEDPENGDIPWVPCVVWHERTDEDPLHQWVRSQIVSLGGVSGTPQRKLADFGR